MDASEDNSGWIKSYYCNSHWYARKSVEDREFEKQEFEMFKDKPWYQKAFPEKFGNMEDALERRLRDRKAKKPTQMSLFSQ